MYIYLDDCDVHCDSTLYTYTIINCCRGEKVIVTTVDTRSHSTFSIKYSTHFIKIMYIQ